MNIVDALIIVFFFLGIMSGMRRGLIKQTVFLVGLILILVISFYLKNPVATFLYKSLPFFNFGGVFEGVAVLNILLYEVIAFLIVFSLLYLVLRIVLVVSGIIEKILKATIVLGFISKILGGIVGFIESYIIVFIALFIFNLPFWTLQGLDDSKLKDKIIYNTPIMSSVVSDANKVVEEINTLSKTYKNDKEKFSEEAINTCIKYEIISKENVEILKKKGKLK